MVAIIVYSEHLSCPMLTSIMVLLSLYCLFLDLTFITSVCNFLIRRTVFFLLFLVCETSFPLPGIIPVPPALETRSFNRWTTREVSSVQFSRSVVSISLWPYGLQHRPPCPSLTPGACSNSCPLSRWCHPTISSSVIPFSSCLQSFPVSGSFPVSRSLHQVAKVLEF